MNIDEFNILTILTIKKRKIIFCSVIRIVNNAEITILNCRNNYLTNLIYSSLPAERLTHLDIRNNNILEQDCSLFSRMVSLKKLHIGNEDEVKIQQNIYNRFVGSLTPLAKLTKLEHLDISKTDIEIGLEYLSDEMKELNCSAKERPESKVKSIEEKLKPYNYHFLAWKNSQLKSQIRIFQNQ